MTRSADTESARQPAFRRNTALEDMLRLTNDLLIPAEQEALRHYEGKERAHPLVFIMGPLRSGTTLMMQWLAASGLVAYPTNLLSRFYGAPLIGAHVQQLLTDPRYDFRGELGDLPQGVGFDSENGKTKGVLSPNEFWYFWRRFLPAERIGQHSSRALEAMTDTKTLHAELSGLTRIFDKPFALKAMHLNYNIPFLANLFPDALFIQLKRDPLTNTASILDARERQLGSREAWYSFIIPEYDRLKDLPPVMQAAGQEFYNTRAVDEGLSTVADRRKLVVQYEDFCADPERIFAAICEKLELGDTAYSGPASFRPSRQPSGKDAEEIAQAVAHFRQTDGEA